MLINKSTITFNNKSIRREIPHLFMLYEKGLDLKYALKLENLWNVKWYTPWKKLINQYI